MNVDLIAPKRGKKSSVIFLKIGKNVKMKQILNVTFMCSDLLLYFVEGLPVRAYFKYFRFRNFEIFSLGYL